MEGICPPLLMVTGSCREPRVELLLHPRLIKSGRGGFLGVPVVSLTRRSLTGFEAYKKCLNLRLQAVSLPGRVGFLKRFKSPRSSF